MDIFIILQKSLDKIVPFGRSMLIRVTRDLLPLPYQYDKILHIPVSDFTEEQVFLHPRIIELHGEIFQKKDALYILEEIVAFRPTQIIVHCNEGISRSPAVAYGIALNMDLENRANEILYGDRYFPNSTIVKIFQELKI